MTYQFCCNATALDVRQVLIDLRAVLNTQSISDDLRSNVEIAVAEGLNNIVEHALCDAQDAQIQIEMCIDSAQIFLLLQDPGAPLPGSLLSEALPADLDVPCLELPEGGFGWDLIHMLTDRLDYSRINGKNRLKMWFGARMPVGEITDQISEPKATDLPS